MRKVTVPPARKSGVSKTCAIDSKYTSSLLKEKSHFTPLHIPQVYETPTSWAVDPSERGDADCAFHKFTKCAMV